MTATLLIVAGYWALQFPGARPQFTRFRSATPTTVVLRAIQWEYRDVQIDVVTDAGWLFPLEELQAEPVTGPLFDGAAR